MTILTFTGEDSAAAMENEECEGTSTSDSTRSLKTANVALKDSESAFSERTTSSTHRRAG